MKGSKTEKLTENVLAGDAIWWKTARGSLVPVKGGGGLGRWWSNLQSRLEEDGHF